jgi:hypothetical protein
MTSGHYCDGCAQAYYKCVCDKQEEKILPKKMNEQIDKLLIEAGAHFGGDGVVYDTFDPKKFAELIVRECMACSIWVGKNNTNTVEPIHTAYAINQRIKQHFGVEE